MNHDETPLVIVLRKLTNPFGQCFVQKEPDQPVLRPSVVTVFMRRPRQMRCTPAHTRRTISHGQRRKHESESVTVNGSAAWSSSISAARCPRGNDPGGTRGAWRRRRCCPHRESRSSLRPTKSRSEEHTSELQSRENLVCRLLLEKKKKKNKKCMQFISGKKKQHCHSSGQ